MWDDRQYDSAIWRTEDLLFHADDIIDGFGSYKDKWMRAPVFTGIGEIAWKWMCLFQHVRGIHAPSCSLAE